VRKEAAVFGIGTQFNDFDFAGNIALLAEFVPFVQLCGKVH